MSAMELDEDVLATLTDEEREAIESGDLSESEQEALKAIAQDDDEDDGDNTDNAPPIEGKDAAGDAAGEASGDADQGDAGEQPGAEDDAGHDDDEDERGFRPAYRSDLPQDFEQQLSDLDTQIDGLAQKFKDGEIDFDQYRAEANAIEAKRADLNTAKLRADLYQDMSAQSAEQEWNWTVNRFIRSTAKTGIDYAKDEAKRNDLDGFVKALAQNEANASKDFDWFLAEAHKRVKALHGIQTAPAKPAGKDTPAASRKPPIDAAPVTLATVPGSEGPGDLAGEFADLDGLDGDALEMAIAKMTPEQREKYARGT